MSIKKFLIMVILSFFVITFTIINILSICYLALYFFLELDYLISLFLGDSASILPPFAIFNIFLIIFLYFYLILLPFVYICHFVLENQIKYIKENNIKTLLILKNICYINVIYNSLYCILFFTTFIFSIFAIIVNLTCGLIATALIAMINSILVLFKIKNYTYNYIKNNIKLIESLKKDNFIKNTLKRNFFLFIIALIVSELLLNLLTI